MIDPTRRGFLHLIGAGVAGLSLPGVDLFAATPGDLLLPGGSEHYVFDSKVLLSPHANAHVLWPGENGQDPMVVLDRQLLHRASQPWAPIGRDLEYNVAVSVDPSEDPHVAFFVAANHLRRKIDADVQALGPYLRGHGLIMVTVVINPIMAHPRNDDRPGFVLHTDIRQYAAPKNDIVNLDKAVSTQGDVPVITPSIIDFKYLLLMQKELDAMGLLTPNKDALVAAQRRIKSRGLFRG